MIAAVALLLAFVDFQSLLSQAGKSREGQRIDEAISLYREAVKLQPASAEAWWYLGLCLNDKQRYDEAAKAFASVAAQLPRQGAGWAMLGISQFRLKQYDKALESLRKAHQWKVPALNGLDRVARYHFAILLNRAGQFDLASGLLMTFVAENAVTPLVNTATGTSALRMNVLPGDLPPTREEVVKLAGEAVILGWQKRPSEAIRKAGILLDKYPEQPNANYLMGYLLLLDQNPKSMEYFERELKLQPDHVQARLQIAYEYVNRGQPEKGLAYAKQAATLAPGDFIARDMLGRILLAVDDVQAAVPELESAVKLQPDSAEAHLHLATAYNRSGRKEAAAREREIFGRLEKERKSERKNE
jgi:tetratricopeptide (TPR) repeat protein